jgi:hypothetical protein
MFSSKLHDTICKTARWSTNDFNKVMWPAHEQAFKTYSTHKRITLVKLIHGLWNSGAQKVKFNQDTDGLCPCCKKTEESLDHIYRCPEPSVVANRTLLLENLRLYLNTIRTPTSLSKCIMAGVSWWVTQFTVTPHRPIAPTAGNVHPTHMLATDAFT